jgi:hypothetical protein
LFETIDSYNGDFVPFARLLARNLGVTLEESEDSFTVDSFVTGRVTRDKSEAIWTVQDIVNARVCPDSGPPCESYLQELKEAEEAFLQEYGNI